MISLAERLRSRGLTLPKPTPPNGTYEPFTRSGSIIFMAGTTCVRDGGFNIPAQLEPICRSKTDRKRQQSVRSTYWLILAWPVMANMIEFVP